MDLKNSAANLIHGPCRFFKVLRIDSMSGFLVSNTIPYQVQDLLVARVRARVFPAQLAHLRARHDHRALGGDRALHHHHARARRR